MAYREGFYENKKKVIVWVILAGLLVAFCIFYFKPRTLEFPNQVDRITVSYQNKIYELNEEDSLVLLDYFKGMKIGNGRPTLQAYTGGIGITFYKNETPLKEIYISAVYTIHSFDKYPIQYISSEEMQVYMDNFLMAIDVRDSVEKCREMLEKQENIEDFEELRRLLGDNDYWEFVSIEDERFVFAISEKGFYAIDGLENGMLESGELRFYFDGDAFSHAELYIDYIEDDTSKNYKAEW